MTQRPQGKESAAGHRPVSARGFSFTYADGGRSATRKGTTGDCGVRALALATGADYEQLYKVFADTQYEWATTGRSSAAKRRAASYGRSASKGINRKIFSRIAEQHGWVARSLSAIGAPSKVRVATSHLPADVPLILNLSRHYSYWSGTQGLDLYDVSRWTDDTDPDDALTFMSWADVPDRDRDIVRPTRMVYSVWHRESDTDKVEAWLAGEGSGGYQQASTDDGVEYCVNVAGVCAPECWHNRPEHRLNDRTPETPAVVAEVADAPTGETDQYKADGVTAHCEVVRHYADKQTDPVVAVVLRQVSVLRRTQPAAATVWQAFTEHAQADRIVGLLACVRSVAYLLTRDNSHYLRLSAADKLPRSLTDWLATSLPLGDWLAHYTTKNAAWSAHDNPLWPDTHEYGIDTTDTDDDGDDDDASDSDSGGGDDDPPPPPAPDPEALAAMRERDEAGGHHLPAPVAESAHDWWSPDYAHQSAKVAPPPESVPPATMLVRYGHSYIDNLMGRDRQVGDIERETKRHYFIRQNPGQVADVIGAADSDCYYITADALSDNTGRLGKLSAARAAGKAATAAMTEAGWTDDDVARHVCDDCGEALLLTGYCYQCQPAR